MIRLAIPFALLLVIGLLLLMITMIVNPKTRAFGIAFFVGGLMVVLAVAMLLVPWTMLRSQHTEVAAAMAAERANVVRAEYARQRHRDDHSTTSAEPILAEVEYLGEFDVIAPGESNHGESAAGELAPGESTLSGSTTANVEVEASPPHELGGDAIDTASIPDDLTSTSGPPEPALDAAATRDSPDARDTPVSALPDWIESPSNRTGDVHTMVVSCGPYPSQQDCQELLRRDMQKATDEYVRWYLQAGMGLDASQIDGVIQGKWLGRPISRLHINPPTLDSNSRRYLESREFDGLGTMYTEHVELVFDRAFQTRIEERWRNVQSAARLGGTAVASGGVLGLLASVFGYLKLDGATKGKYRGPLRMGAGAAILGLVGSATWLIGWFPLL